ncbi:MAG: hypothetical protein II135_04745 [Clostridia bacterium]|nr:hypothetical protein [Clostridia bacterium]MBQ3870959.1 hypothetical protein [Clostridia bacterium]
MADKKSNDAAKEAAKRALEAAAAKKAAPKKKIEHTYTQVGQQSATQDELLAATRQNALPYRIVAIILWILGIGCEVMAILLFTFKVQFKFTAENPGWMISWIVCLALDLILVIIGSLLWKKGNHLDPAPKKNKVRFWLQNNLGVIIAIVAFVPFIIIALTDKKADKKSKIIATVIAAVALLIGGLFGIDWNPISQEEMLENAHIETVFWTDSGTVYHAYDDCGHLSNTVNLNTGTSATAIENGKTRLCKSCEARAQREAEAAEENNEENKTPADTAAEANQ